MDTRKRKDERIFASRMESLTLNAFEQPASYDAMDTGEINEGECKFSISLTKV